MTIAAFRKRPKGRHIALADYENRLGRNHDPIATPEEELSAARDAAGLPRVTPIDCPDCGRTLAVEGRCRKCGGSSWLPAGHVDRRHLRRLLEAAEGGEE